SQQFSSYENCAPPNERFCLRRYSPRSARYGRGSLVRLYRTEKDGVRMTGSDFPQPSADRLDKIVGYVAMGFILAIVGFLVVTNRQLTPQNAVFVRIALSLAAA